MGYVILKDMLNKKIVRVEVTHDELKLFTKDGYFHFYHEPDCCEEVSIEDICGDIEDINDIILMAEVSTNLDEPPQNKFDESYTWTYFKIGTRKGQVTIRFYGNSNGYYSEDVDIDFVSNDNTRKNIHRSYTAWR
jgi:hypothetical protein